jgi:erythromycin esterase-like protein
MSRAAAVALLACLSPCILLGEEPRQGSSVAGRTDLQRAVALSCGATTVLLGEASHGTASAIDLKAALVKELVTRCGFTHVVFESQLYDFEALKGKYATSSASMGDLLNAIGGLWATARELDDLALFLHGRALAHELTLSGIDGQVGGAMNLYSQTALAADLTASLPPERRTHCAAEIQRLNQWRFDASHPNDERFKAGLSDCLRDADLATPEADVARRLLLSSYAGFLSLSEKDYANQRDRLMFRNFSSIMRSMPPRTKSIVWTASRHALLAEYRDIVSLGSLLSRESPGPVKAIAFVAKGGTYGFQGKPAQTIDAAPPGTVEADAFPGGSEAGVAFLAGPELSRLSGRPSRLLGYGKFLEGPWAKLFDGVFVARSERAPAYVRPRTPQQ